jgi:hypothetical protein
VPPERFGEFVAVCQEVIGRSKLEFLNVTLRYVAADNASVLSFAPTRRIAAVMSFSQELRPEDEVDMMRTTEALIDRVIAIGGSFYLPYRLHARRDQVEKAYPNVARFIERKRHYDPPSFQCHVAGIFHEHSPEIRPGRSLMDSSVALPSLRNRVCWLRCPATSPGLTDAQDASSASASRSTATCCIGFAARCVPPTCRGMLPSISSSCSARSTSSTGCWGW